MSAPDQGIEAVKIYRSVSLKNRISSSLFVPEIWISRFVNPLFLGCKLNIACFTIGRSRKANMKILLIAAYILTGALLSPESLARDNSNSTSASNTSAGTGAKAEKDISRVQGYQKQNGTQVPSHLRSTPDSSTTNNWSTKGNTNPATGNKGTQGGRSGK